MDVEMEAKYAAERSDAEMHWQATQEQEREAAALKAAKEAINADWEREEALLQIQYAEDRAKAYDTWVQETAKTTNESWQKSEDDQQAMHDKQNAEAYDTWRKDQVLKLAAQEDMEALKFAESRRMADVDAKLAEERSLEQRTPLWAKLWCGSDHSCMAQYASPPAPSGPVQKDLGLLDTDMHRITEGETTIAKNVPPSPAQYQNRAGSLLQQYRDAMKASAPLSFNDSGRYMLTYFQRPDATRDFQTFTGYMENWRSTAEAAGDTQSLYAQAVFAYQNNMCDAGSVTWCTVPGGFNAANFRPIGGMSAFNAMARQACLQACQAGASCNCN
jgi:hypothetical protein